MPHPTIRVTIYEDSQREQCSGGCGMDCSAAETQQFIKEHLKQLYGEMIKVEHVDLAAPSCDQSHIEFAQSIKARDFMLPLVLINGKPRLSGYFDMRQLKEAIQTEIETSHE